MSKSPINVYDRRNEGIGMRLRNKILPEDMRLRLRVTDAAYYLSEALYDYMSANKTSEEMLIDKDKWGVPLSRNINEFISAVTKLAEHKGVDRKDPEFLEAVLGSMYAWAIPFANLTNFQVPLESAHELIRLLQAMPKHLHDIQVPVTLTDR